MTPPAPSDQPELPELPALPKAPELPGYRHVASGKVRDLYAPDGPDEGGCLDNELLMVASDRVSAFDYVLSSLIPDKGRILTAISLWWFERLEPLVGNHVLTATGPRIPDAVAGRAVLVRRLRMLPVECVGRAYLTGSGLVDYQAHGSVCGLQLPAGLVEASRLEPPIFTPTTKAPLGQHDLPMTYEEVARTIGGPLAARVRDLTCAILERGNELARQRGILIADTKVEFGVPLRADASSDTSPDMTTDMTSDVEVLLADEVLTPDSSRFWPANEWTPGRPQRSYDKQYVRDWLKSSASGWDPRSGPPPPLPDDVVAATRATYVAAYEALTGRCFD